jgi:hypothetical protein
LMADPCAPFADRQLVTDYWRKLPIGVYRDADVTLHCPYDDCGKEKTVTCAELLSLRVCWCNYCWRAFRIDDDVPARVVRRHKIWWCYHCNPRKP